MLARSNEALVRSVAEEKALLDASRRAVVKGEEEEVVLKEAVA